MPLPKSATKTKKQTGAKIRLIINPQAGNGKFAKVRSQFEKQVAEILGPVAFSITKSPGEATALTREALQGGQTTIVAFGGDGTVNEVVNGFFAEGKLINPEARLAVIAMGTGSDFLKSRPPQILPDYLEKIWAEEASKCDVGRVRFMDQSGNETQRYFINIASVGFGGKLVKIANESTKALGPVFSYLSGLIRTLAIYKNQPVRIHIDGQALPEQIVNSVVIANGQFFGGGMWVASGAKTDDSFFEVIIIGNVSRAEVLTNMHLLYNGKLDTHPKVQRRQAKQVSLDSDTVLVEADGELIGKLPAYFEMLPQQINLV